VLVEVEDEDAVLETVGVVSSPIVLKGCKSPESWKVPFPVWQSHLVRGSLSQQKSPVALSAVQYWGQEDDRHA